MVEHTHQTEAEAARAGETPNEIGEMLRNQRKARGISLIEVSEHTKIGKKYLEALEDGRYELLPCETYIRGFLKAYAKYLELEDDQILKMYKDKKNPPKPGEKEVKVEGEEETVKNSQAVWVPLLSLLVLAGFGAGLFLLWPAPQPSGTPAGMQPAEEAAALPAGNTLPVAGPVAQLPRVLKADEDMTLTVKCKEKTWVTVMVDGRQEPDVTLNPGEEQTWKAKERFVLWTGNAGGLEVLFNGELQPPLGKPGEVRKEIIFERRPQAPAAAVPNA